jgi:hypothetical protein
MKLCIRELDQDFKHIPGKYVSYPRNGGYASVEEMQHELFRRNTGPSVENRWIKFIPTGVIIIEFSCNNYGYRDYDYGDYNFRLIQRITLED